MSLTVQAHWVQKFGNSEAEYEDAFAFHCATQRSGQRYQPRCRLAVADGATDSWCSGLWAGLLVDAATQGKANAEYVVNHYDQLRQRWRRDAVPDDLDWVSEEKARGGAHAAIIALSVKPATEAGEPGVWSVWAVGDCCLFQLRGGQIVTSFPYSLPEQFTSSPILLGTATPADELMSLVSEFEGSWLPGDEFLLATDAMALWCMQRIDEGGRYDEAAFGAVSRLLCRESFTHWVNAARERGELRNDDTTLVSLRTG
jgi:hypothetical protein